jgi:hypothetical protein
MALTLRHKSLNRPKAIQSLYKLPDKKVTGVGLE